MNLMMACCIHRHWFDTSKLKNQQYTELTLYFKCIAYPISMRIRLFYVCINEDDKCKSNGALMRMEGTKCNPLLKCYWHTFGIRFKVWINLWSTSLQRTQGEMKIWKQMKQTHKIHTEICSLHYTFSTRNRSHFISHCII